jgi:hypothetical protein
MIERGDSAGFAFKPAAEIGRRIGFAKYFDRDIPAKARVVGAVDLAHAACAES